MRRLWLIAATALGSTGCHLVSGVGDFDFAAGSGAAGSGGAAPCVEPVAGMKIGVDTRLCGGTYPLWDAEAVIEVVAHGVELICEGTVLEGPGPPFPEDMPVSGIRFDYVSNVAVRGCTVRGYRHGLVAEGGGDLVIEEVHLDDNFTDPAAGWVYDVPGGGLLLREVSGGHVSGSSFAGNWNGIELRNTTGVLVENNVADHCSNAGAYLVGSSDNELRKNDFSFGVRGDNLVFPDVWYGQDTRDSAGIILDGGSHQNLIADNDASHGGDGIFMRGLVIGGCSERNTVSGNDASFSPHNGIETSCDEQIIEGNVIAESDYGIWAGGGDRLVIRGNTITDSRVDGISLQIAGNRHVLIEDNTIAGSDRCGVLLSGREYQAWHDLDTYWSPEVANASHFVVQRNDISNSTICDVFASSVRLLGLASNCAENVQLGEEVELDFTVGSCGGAAGATAPTASLLVPTSAQLGALIQLDAGGSGDEPAFHWLVQPAGALFAGGVLPPFLLGGPGPDQRSLVIDTPGAYDVDVIVTDGQLAALADRQITAAPVGQPIGQQATDWDYLCVEECTATFEDESGGDGDSHVHVTTDYGFNLVLRTPPRGTELNLDVTGLRLGFFVRAYNDNPLGGWQSPADSTPGKPKGGPPVVVLGSDDGTIRYTPGVLFPVDGDDWVYIEVPLDGGPGWEVTDEGGVLTDVDWVEIHVDTWEFGWELWVDALTFY